MTRLKQLLPEVEINLNHKLLVHYVPVNFIAQLWPKVKDMLEAALTHSAGEYNADQLKVMLVNGLQVLLIAERDGKIYGAATIHFENYPNDRIAFMTAIGGRMIANQDCWQQFLDWARANGCTKVRGAAFEAVARLWRQKFGVESRYIIVEKSL